MISKKINYLFLTLFTLFLSCSESDSETPDEEQNTQSISLHITSKDALINTNINYTVITDTKFDVTDKSTLFVDGKKVSLPYALSKLGKHTVYAIYEGLKTNEETIEVHDELQNSILPEFKKRALIEEYTATWCPACPQLYDLTIAKAEEKHSNAMVVMAIHHGNDGISNDLTESMRTHFPSPAYASIFLEREEKGFLALFHIDLETVVKEPANVAIGIGYSIKNEDFDVQIDLEFKEKQTTKNKLAVYILENGIIKDQKTYENGEAATLKNYEHNHTLKYALTDKLGDPIPITPMSNDHKYSIRYKKKITDFPEINNFSNIEIVAVVTDSKDKVLNAQKLKKK
jgi:thiol-disulfide isomerase/thioredoxin